MPFVDVNKKREYSRKHKQKIRKKLLETIGNRCIFCGFNGLNGIQFHQIYGKKHLQGYEYTLRNQKDFVPICIFCHRALNQLSRLNNDNLAKFLCYLILNKGLNRAKQYYNLRDVCKQWFDLFGKLVE